MKRSKPASQNSIDLLTGPWLSCILWWARVGIEHRPHEEVDSRPFLSLFLIFLKTNIWRVEKMRVLLPHLLL